MCRKSVCLEWSQLALSSSPPQDLERRNFVCQWQARHPDDDVSACKRCQTQLQLQLECVEPNIAHSPGWDGCAAHSQLAKSHPWWGSCAHRPALGLILALHGCKGEQNGARTFWETIHP